MSFLKQHWVAVTVAVVVGLYLWRRGVGAGAFATPLPAAGWKGAPGEVEGSFGALATVPNGQPTIQQILARQKL